MYICLLLQILVHSNEKYVDIRITSRIVSLRMYLHKHTHTHTYIYIYIYRWRTYVFWAQISPMSAPGMFRVWAILEDGSLQSLTLEVPRIFYVNYRTKWDLLPLSCIAECFALLAQSETWCFFLVLLSDLPCCCVWAERNEVTPSRELFARCLLERLATTLSGWVSKMCDIYRGTHMCVCVWLAAKRWHTAMSLHMYSIVHNIYASSRFLQQEMSVADYQAHSNDVTHV